MIRRCARRRSPLILFILAILYAPGLEAAAPLQKIVFVFAGFNERSGFSFVAKDMRFFEEQGLDAQIYSTSATGASLGAMAGGLDLVFIAGIINKLDGAFVVAPKINAPAELKGKLICVQSIGGGVW